MDQVWKKRFFRIESVEHKVNKKSEEVLKKVIKIIRESEGETLESVLDRVHHIGPTYTENDTGTQYLDIEPYFIQITKRLNLVPKLDYI